MCCLYVCFCFFNHCDLMILSLLKSCSEVFLSGKAGTTHSVRPLHARNLTEQVQVQLNSSK